jgi:crotonobetainyl-CoA:carnitine CoA-transferase CaiB-like acyl-CoA transferase
VCTQWLAALGADVIHVESVQRPDGIRSNTTRELSDPEWPEWSPYFHVSNNDKRGLTLDMSSAEGRLLAERLIATSDVLVENYSPRVFENWGLSWERVKEINPRIVMVRLPAYGLSGPWRDRGGYAQTIEMAAGLAASTGYADRSPAIPNGACDPIAGTHGAVGALLGLALRERTGLGSMVENPMIGAALAFAAEQLVDYSAYGAPTVRRGNRSLLAAPQGLYPTRDGAEERIAISIENDTQWQALRKALGDPQWAADPDLATLPGRIAAHDLIDEHLTAWAVGRDADEAVEWLCAAGVAAARVLFPHQQDQVEQLAAREYFVRLDHPVTGSTTYNETPMVLERGPRRTVSRPAPTLGQHNREVLTEMGLTAQEIDRLEAEGVIGTRPRTNLRAF